MSDQAKAVEDKKEYSAEDFALEYKALCEKTGWQVVSSLAWVARDDATYSTVIQHSVGKTPKQS